MIHPLFQAILNTWIPPLLEQEEPEAFQCKRCHRIYSADDTQVLNNFDCLCGGALVGIPLERYEDHLHALNMGEL